MHYWLCDGHFISKNIRLPAIIVCGLSYGCSDAHAVLQHVRGIGLDQSLRVDLIEHAWACHENLGSAVRA